MGYLPLVTPPSGHILRPNFHKFLVIISDKATYLRSKGSYLDDSWPHHRCQQEFETNGVSSIDCWVITPVDALVTLPSGHILRPNFHEFLVIFSDKSNRFTW